MVDTYPSTVPSVDARGAHARSEPGGCRSPAELGAKASPDGERELKPKLQIAGASVALGAHT
jgi:hypothetical protein